MCPRMMKQAISGPLSITLLSKVALPDKNIHRIKGEEAPDKAARDYEEEIRRFFGGSERPGFDLIILGVGEDGHTASLFPGSKSLEETVRLAVPVYLGEPRKNRITLTLPVLNNADQILFLVAGSSKAAVLSEILGEREKKKAVSCRVDQPCARKYDMVDRSRSSGEIRRVKVSLTVSKL